MVDFFLFFWTILFSLQTLQEKKKKSFDMHSFSCTVYIRYLPCSEAHRHWWMLNIICSSKTSKSEICFLLSILILTGHAESSTVSFPNFYLFCVGHSNFIMKSYFCDNFCKLVSFGGKYWLFPISSKLFMVFPLFPLP